jgi:hypothetical protein
MSPTSGTWRNLCGSSIAYGLTEGGYAANEIRLTELGRRLVAPTEEGQELAARTEAVLHPRVLRDFFQRYDKAKMPREDIAQNVLVTLGLPKERAPAAFEILKRNGIYAGLIIDTKTGPFVAIGAQPALSSPETASYEAEPAVGPSPVETRTDEMPREVSGPKQIFIAHGKNKGPLEELKKVLDKFKIPYRVAVDEPHVGRPISKKVADLMKNCSAGIFIFTQDEKFSRDDGEEIWRPSENVVYELGAAGVLWERKIIIMKQEGVNFPSDFNDLGYITFGPGGLASKTLEIFTELVGLGFVTVQAA